MYQLQSERGKGRDKNVEIYIHHITGTLSSSQQALLPPPGRRQEGHTSSDSTSAGYTEERCVCCHDYSAGITIDILYTCYMERITPKSRITSIARYSMPHT